MRIEKTVAFIRNGLSLLPVAIVVGGCTGLPSETTQEISRQDTKTVAELTNTAFHPQETYQCGPAALATVLNSSDIETSPDALVSKIYIPQRQGSLQLEIIATTRTFDRLPYILNPQLDAVIAEIDAGRPVLVMQNLGVKWLPLWHYAVVVGYDKRRQEIVLRSGRIERKRYSFKLFDRTWRRSGRWAMVAVKPTEIPITADEDEYLRTILPFEHAQRWNVALKAYTTASNKWPDSLGAQMGSGNSYYALNKFTKSITYYRKALLIDSSHAPAHNNIANAFFETGELEEAEEHANNAIMLGGPYLDAFKQTLAKIQRN
ncbi:MAG: PA2778 family cysteine peptidase [Acidiferrobacterales bacterium]